MRVAVLADFHGGLLRLAEEARDAVVRPEEEGVVGFLLRQPGDHRYAALDLHLLLVGILLPVMPHIPAERDPELINEVLPRLRLLVFRREVERLALAKIRDEGADLRMAFLKCDGDIHARLRENGQSGTEVEGAAHSSALKIVNQSCARLTKPLP